MTVEEFDFNIDSLQVLLWQYNDALNIQSLIEKKQTWTNINVSQFINDWYTNVFNLETANDFGLQVWAIILGVKFSVLSQTPTLVFGFEGGQNFLNGSFFPSVDNILTTEQKRTILRFRYLELTTNANLDKLQSAVSNILPGSKVLDGLDMSLLITYPTYPDSQTIYIIQNFDIFPRPAGVKIGYVFNYSHWIGFNNSGSNFNYANFGG